MSKKKVKGVFKDYKKKTISILFIFIFISLIVFMDTNVIDKKFEEVDNEIYFDQVVWDVNNPIYYLDDSLDKESLQDDILINECVEIFYKYEKETISFLKTNNLLWSPKLVEE